MESNRSSKRRSFSKSKLLASFRRAAKPSKPNSSFTSLEFMATQPMITPSSPSVGYVIVNQDQVFTPQKPKVAFVVPNEYYGKLENFYGGTAEDEAVDAKAAMYISGVKERFRLERLNSEHN